MVFNVIADLYLIFLLVKLEMEINKKSYVLIQMLTIVKLNFTKLERVLN